MDPYAPINGISLERYAELGAEIDGITDPEAQAQKVGELGVQRHDWEAAKSGWTARMQDMSLMGQVAMRYMPLYNAALAARKGTASVSFEDWVAISAAIGVFGWEGAMGHYKISQGDWTTINGHWMGEGTRDANVIVQKNQAQEAEMHRLRSGGQPKPVNVSRQAAGAPVAGGANAFDQNAHAAAQNQYGQQQQVASMQYAMGVLGTGLGQVATGMAGAMNQLAGGSGLVVGQRVLVQWADGNRYPGQLMQNQGGQCQVQMQDGQAIWVESKYLTTS
jgi:hypothetical protein